MISSFRGSETFKCRGGREGGRGLGTAASIFSKMSNSSNLFSAYQKNLLNILGTLEGIILSNLKVKMAI